MVTWLPLVLLALTTGCASTATGPATGGPPRYRDVAEYRAARERLIAEDRAMRLGAGLGLSADEEEANRRLMALKQQELDRTREYFPPAESFLKEKTKQLVAESPVFAVMKRLPKGGVLHAHGGALGDFRWLVSAVAYRPDCYIYVGSQPGMAAGTLRIASQSPGDGWRPVNELRAAASDPRAFDDDLYRAITLGEEDLDAPNIWREFSTIFRRTSGLVGHPSVSREYWRRLLAGLIEDNVQYLESRGITIDEAIIDEARGLDADFGVTFIAAAGRSGTREQIAESLTRVIERRAREPGRVKGFDLVEEEDSTQPNLYFVDQLLAARRAAEARGVTLPLYLHSGETNRAENENLYDAVLLGASRIGHGIALFKHPRLLQLVKERGIAVEVCPISNQILGYVADLRTHPAAHYINAGLPIVLSTDDPAIFRQTLSHDFYAAFMAWGLDLRSLKQLAMNSLLYSAMDPADKKRALAAWGRRWTAFVAWLKQQEPLSANEL